MKEGGNLLLWPDAQQTITVNYGEKARGKIDNNFNRTGLKGKSGHSAPLPALAKLGGTG